MSPAAPYSIRLLTLDDAMPQAAALNELLRDAVDGGSSVGFLPPLQPDEATAFWEGIWAEARVGLRIILGAFEAESGALVGSVQLVLSPKPNAACRAEVQKLLVHSRARRQGIGRALMAAIEAEARRLQRPLLVLDTETDSGAERLYAAIGYQRVGIIPAYALGSDRVPRDCTFFYKQI